MSGDFTLPMPSDLRPFGSPFHLESNPPKRMGLVGLTVEIPSTSHSKSSAEEARPPARWKTLEFRFYTVLACIVVPLMAWVPMTLSFSSHPNYPFFHSRLSGGWLFGRKIDNSDSQYRSFRNNIPALSVAACVYLFVKFVWIQSAATPPQDNLYLIPFNLFFSIIMLLALHGTSIIKVLIILTLNYAIAKSCKQSKLGPVLTWVFNVAILFANDRYSGYQFGTIFPGLGFLDGYQGIYPRWHINFNITMLRLVSFSMDYYWASHRTDPLETGRSLTEKQRQTVVHPLDMYSYMNYISYVLYPPLYIAGPIMTFNDYLWQHRRPTLITGYLAMGYFFRFLISLFTMEFILHFMYVVAIKDTKAWMGDTPAQISMIGFWNLIIVWLKLLIPWRFFRLWALMDGIDPPENMVRCMVNNYSTFGFWRSWHRSYNLWIIRYIYIPIGGTKHVIVNSVLVFTFVALWHDLTFRLLAWGWLVSLFILPELAARYFLPASKYGTRPWYRHICALGAVANMLMMVAANLVGFVIGTDGVKFFLEQLFGTSEGLRFLVGAFFCMFVGAQIMFEYREEEMRTGIYRRC